MPTPPTLGSRVRVNDDVLFQDLHGEGVLLNLKTGVYFGLDGAGTRIWELFERHSVLSEILDVILAEYDVSAERGAGDLVVLVADMEKHGLVTVDNQ